MNKLAGNDLIFGIVEAERRFNDYVVMYSLTIEDGMIYIGVVFNETPDIQKFQWIGNHWIYVGDYWENETVWVEVDR